MYTILYSLYHFDEKRPKYIKRVGEYRKLKKRVNRVGPKKTFYE